MANLEERFLNVLEGKRYALTNYCLIDYKVTILKKWITYDEAVQMKRFSAEFGYSGTYIYLFIYLFIWKNGSWNPLLWGDGTPYNDISKCDNEIVSQGLELLNNDES